MAKYEIKGIVCDYGLYEDGELKLILNSTKNADTIKRILEIDGSVPNVATVADFVEVVRCKDCLYWDGRGYDGRCEAPNNGLIREYSIYDDFCSYGERKTEND